LSNKKRLILVMGIQRGGTTVLFKSLAADYDCAGYHEHLDSEVFLNWNLRPEKEIRDVLRATERPAILKPINETTFRSVEDVLREYGDYDVRIVWPYRDPCDVFYSTVDFFQHDRRANDPFYEGLVGLSSPEAAVDGFVEQWNRRHRSALDAQAVYSDRVFIVSYEDILRDVSVFDGLCRAVGVKGVYIFRMNTRRSRMLTSEVRARIHRGTAETQKALAAARSFRPGRALTPRLHAWILTRRAAGQAWG